MKSRRMLYAQVAFDRGAGLGNRLFPWARAKIFCRINGARLLSPRWCQFRIGPLLRGGIDLGTFHRQFLLMQNFRGGREYIHGFERLKARIYSTVTLEPSNFRDRLDNDSETSLIVTFQGDRDRFQSLHGFEQYIFDEILAMTRRRWLMLAECLDQVCIAANVRCARDFRDPDLPDPSKPSVPIRTPLRWFLETVRIIRRQCGFQVPVVVVSDGTTKELADLLSMPEVRFVRPGCAISDLIILSRSKILLASGGSSFSAWAAFLGKMPVVTWPGQTLDRFGLKHEKRAFIGSFNPSKPSGEFLAAVSDAVKTGALSNA